MEVIRFIPLLVFLLFCGQIVYKQFRLTKQGIKVSGMDKSAKSILSLVFVLVFFVIYVSELLYKSNFIKHSFLPKLLSEEIYESAFSAIFGIMFLLLSLICMYKTLRAFDNSLRFGLDAENTGTLVTEGIFSYSRNPFFVSIILLFLGIFLVAPTPFYLVTLVLSIVSIHFFILKEEKFMHEIYAQNYTEYTKKVRRYF